MSTLKYIAIMILALSSVILLSGCEDDSHDRVTVYNDDGDHDGQNHDTNDSHPPYGGSSEPSHGGNNNNGSGGGDVNIAHKVTLRNSWSQNIVFTVGNVSKNVTPGGTEQWNYYGSSVTVSSTVFGYPWSQSWNDGLNHNYVATQSSGAVNVPDFYESSN